MYMYMVPLSADKPPTLTPQKGLCWHIMGGGNCPHPARLPPPQPVNEDVQTYLTKNYTYKHI